MPPRVSVVIDNYNYGRFLGQCIQSALDQDYPRDLLEIIVVDDGSTDDSRAVAEGFGTRLRLILQENSGQAGAFSAGLAAARGEIVCLMDSDDYWRPEKVRTVAAAFDEAQIGVVQHPLLDVDEQGRALPTNLPEWPARYALADYLGGRVALAAASGLALRRNVLRDILPIPLDIAYASDAYLIAHGLLSCQAANLGQVLGCHRIHGRNNWAGYARSAEKLETGLRLREAFHRHLDPKLQARGLAYGRFFLQCEAADIKRERLLIAMHRRRRGEAFRLWKELWQERPASSFNIFKCLTLLPAFISPDLYLALNRCYARNTRLRRLRELLCAGAGRRNDDAQAP